MAATATVQVRMDPELKKAAENMFSSMGLSMSAAINLFVRQSVIQGKLPFEIISGESSGKKNETFKVLEEMSAEEFDELMLNGLKQAEANETYSLDEVFEDLKKGLRA